MILDSIDRSGENRLSLSTVVRYARSPEQRKQIIKQYWSAFATAADLQFAQQELELLAGIPQPVSGLDRMLLRAATSSARARVAEAQIAYNKSSNELRKFVPTIEADQLISFADLPWVGKYRTNSEGFVRSGLFDSRIRQVDSALPQIRDLVYLRGAAFYENMAAFRQAVAALNQGNVRLETVLKLHNEMRDQRIAFLKYVRTYNHAIADYAISVFPQATDPQTVAGMLIDTDLTLPDGTIRDPNVRQAGGQSLR